MRALASARTARSRVLEARALEGRHGGRRAPRAGPRRRAVYIRRRLAAGALAALLVVALVSLLASGGGASSGRTTAVGRGGAPPRGDSATAATPARRAGGDAGTSSELNASSAAGSLPQTTAFPSARGAQFHVLMGDLWQGVVHDSLSRALPAFFPRSAYLQLKAIYSAGSDWTDRLVRDYSLDIAAAHALLGRDASRAALLGVDVVSSYGHWVPPGACYNSIGYYEMPNARVVYREDGQERSFGIASLISWRGVWYVVHLGAVLRSSEGGEVDEPASGRGTSSYSGTC